jgi:outer membrane receptor protein involved in Fe transport
MLDGVPQGDPFGGWINWPAFDPSGIAEVRVVRGGGSVADGPGALAGTIELTGRTDRAIGGEIDVGSRNSLEANGRAGVRLGAGILNVSGRFERGDGFIPITADTRGPADQPAPYRAWNGRARWVTALGATTEVQASLSGFHDWRTRGTDYSDNRTNGVDGSLRLVGRGSWQWSALGYWQWRDLMSSFASVGAGRLTATQISLQDKVPSDGFGGGAEVRPPMPADIELRFGADARRTDGESRELYSYVAGDPTRRRIAGGESWTAGAFAEGTADLGHATLTTGWRIDHWQVLGGHLFEKLLATDAVTRDDHFASREGWLPTARGGLRTPIGGGFSIRGAAYLGWRMPTLNELFRPFRAGLDATAANPGLDPERLAGAEAGVEFARAGWRLAATGFVNRLSNAIANVTLGQGPGVFPGVGFVAAGGTYRERQNVRAVDVQGIEASANWSSGPWSLGGGFSLTHARIGPLWPAQTPALAATFSAGWDEGGKSALIQLRHIGGQYEDDLNSRLLEPATTLDASATWPLTRRLQLIARGENLTDALVMAGVGGDGSIERATPRTLWIGLRLR